MRQLLTYTWTLLLLVVLIASCAPKPVQVVQQMAEVQVQLTKDTDPRSILSAVPYIYVEHRLLDKTANSYSYLFDIKDDYRANLLYSLYAIESVVAVDGELKPPVEQRRRTIRAQPRTARQ